MKKFNNKGKVNALKRFKLHQGGAIVIELVLSIFIFFGVLAFMSELAYIRNLQARADSAAYRLLDMLRTDALWTYTDHNNIVATDMSIGLGNPPNTQNEVVQYRCTPNNVENCGTITGVARDNVNQDSLQQLLLGQKRNFRPLTDLTLQTLYSTLSYLMQVNFNKPEGHKEVQMVIERYEDLNCDATDIGTTDLEAVDPNCNRDTLINYNNSDISHIMYTNRKQVGNVTQEYTYRRYSGYNVPPNPPKLVKEKSQPKCATNKNLRGKQRKQCNKEIEKIIKENKKIQENNAELLKNQPPTNSWLAIQGVGALSSPRIALKINREQPANGASSLQALQAEAAIRNIRKDKQIKLRDSKTTKNQKAQVPVIAINTNSKGISNLWNAKGTEAINVTCAPKKYLNDPAFQVLSVVDSQSTGTARKLPMYQVTLCVNAKGLFSRLITGKDGDYSFRTSAFGVARQTL